MSVGEAIFLWCFVGAILLLFYTGAVLMFVDWLDRRSLVAARDHARWMVRTVAHDGSDVEVRIGLGWRHRGVQYFEDDKKQVQIGFVNLNATGWQEMLVDYELAAATRAAHLNETLDQNERIHR